MERTLVIALTAAVIAGATGCAAASTHVAAPPRGIAIAADLPPSPATWPAYPHFSRHSCWDGSVTRGVPPKLVGSAPSYAPAPRAHPIPPVDIVRRFLARFGDRRYIHSITLGPAPATDGSKASLAFAHDRPPADALKAYIHAPLAASPNEASHLTPAQSLAHGMAQFEAELVGGALRDDFCSAGGVPLPWWSGAAGGWAERNFPFEQRFPNPAPAAFRRRVALVGRRFGFHVASLRLLHPEQFAPLLIVKTNRPRKAFVKDAGRIVSLLAPTSFAPHLHRVGGTFEGFFFAAEDSRDPFWFEQSVSRTDGGGTEWAASPCLLPPGPVGPTPCS